MSLIEYVFIASIMLNLVLGFTVALLIREP